MAKKKSERVYLTDDERRILASTNRTANLTKRAMILSCQLRLFLKFNN